MGSKTDTRQRMVISAALLLRERGVAGTSIAGVLEHSGGPRGSVGYHFPGGRSELLTDALRWVGGLVSARLKAGLDARTPAAELFADICDFYRGELTSTDFAAGCPVGAAAQESFGDDELGPVVAGIIDEWTALLAESLIIAGMAADRAGETALAAITALEGAIMMARVKRSIEPVDLVAAMVLPTLQATGR